MSGSNGNGGSDVRNGSRRQCEKIETTSADRLIHLLAKIIGDEMDYTYSEGIIKN